MQTPQLRLLENIPEDVLAVGEHLSDLFVGRVCQ